MSDILLVDDDENIRLQVTKLLETDDYNVTVAENGEEGLDRFLQLQPPIVLADIQMPEMDGLELLEAIKRSDPETEVIVITGTGGEETAIEALKKDAFSYIRKPIDFEKLKIEIDRALEKQVLRKKLAQSKKLAAIGEMSAGIMHEINNPNAFIKGNIEFLENVWRDLKGYIDEEAPEETLDAVDATIDDIAEGARRIEKIVNEVELFHRESDPQESMNEFNPLGIITEAIQELKERRNDVEVTIESNVVDTDDPPHDNPELDGSTEEFRQLVVNLLENAIDAVADVDHEPRVRCDFEETESEQIMTVEDNGAGISDDVRQKIFDPFFTTKSIAQRTGLGLSVAKGIVLRMGGQIEVHSEPDSGTRIKVSYPKLSHNDEIDAVADENNSVQS